MQAQEKYRETHRRASTAHMGRNPQNRRWLASHVAVDGTDPEIWNLPVSGAGAIELQDSQGRLRVLAGYVSITGDDVP